MGAGTTYAPRSPTTSVLYGVVRRHLGELLAAIDMATDGAELPGFVVSEFRKFLRCGVLARREKQSTRRSPISAVDGEGRHESLIPGQCRRHSRKNS